MDSEKRFGEMEDWMRKFITHIKNEKEHTEERYTPKRLLIALNQILLTQLNSQSVTGKEYVQLIAKLGAMQLELGLDANHNGEVSTGHMHMCKCLEIIEHFQREPEFAYITMRVLVELGVFWADKERNMSKAYLKRAEALYKEIKGKKIRVINYIQLFDKSLQDNDDTVNSEMDDAYKRCLLYLNIVLDESKDEFKYAVHSHKILQRLLEGNHFLPITWAAETAALYKFFLERVGFRQARHHLAASSYIMDKYERELRVKKDGKFSANIAVLRRLSADVARYWATYGIMVLKISNDCIINYRSKRFSERSLSAHYQYINLGRSNEVSEDDCQSLYFPTLDLSKYENKVTAELVETFEDALKVFTHTQECLAKAATYYTLQDNSLYYLEICLQQSEMYESLSNFEINPENVAKLNKRRLDILENALKDVFSIPLNLGQKIWFQLGLIYRENVNIKSNKLATSHRNARATKKNNSLAARGILFFQNYIQSFEDDSTGKIPRSVPEELHKQFLHAHFFIGDMYRKCIMVDEEKKLKNIESSKQCFKKLVEYARNDVRVQHMIPEKLIVAKQFLTMLSVNSGLENLPVS